jgi:hypothetical protein
LVIVCFRKLLQTGLIVNFLLQLIFSRIFLFHAKTRRSKAATEKEYDQNNYGQNDFYSGNRFSHHSDLNYFDLNIRRSTLFCIGVCCGENFITASGFLLEKAVDAEFRLQNSARCRYARARNVAKKTV